MAVMYIYGSDRYEMIEKRKFIVDNFSQKYGALNVFKINVEKENIDNLFNIDDIFSENMFSEKKMIVINFEKMLNEDSSQQIIDILPNVPDFCILLIVIFKVDKRFKLHKKIDDSATNKYEILELTQKEKSTYLKSVLKMKNANINNDAFDYLLKVIPEDRGIINNELDKIISYNNTITLDVLYVLLSRKIEDDIFVFIDYFLKNKKEDCLKIWNDIKIKESDEYAIIGTLQWVFRMMLIAKYTSIYNYNPYDVAKNLAINPWQLKQYMDLVKNYSLEDILSLFNKILMIDENVKSGVDSDIILAIEDLIIYN